MPSAHDTKPTLRKLALSQCRVVARVLSSLDRMSPTWANDALGDAKVRKPADPKQKDATSTEQHKTMAPWPELQSPNCAGSAGKLVETEGQRDDGKNVPANR